MSVSSFNTLQTYLPRKFGIFFNASTISITFCCRHESGGGTLLGGQFDWGGRLQKSNGGAQRLAMRMPLNRNDRIRYTGRIDEKIFERAVRIGMSVITVPTTNAMSVTNSV